MAAKACYCLILVVYMGLWICQQIACHLTHSLIILTDSYMNVYKLLEVSLGIIHLQTHQRLAKNAARDKADSKDISLFGRICTYQFNRLQEMGSFFNGLFLSALLILAAIEGIQTCFHVDHARIETNHTGIPGEQLKLALLLKQPFAYPIMLVGFAIVDLVMQLCLSQTHLMRFVEIDALEGRAKAKSQLVELSADLCLADMDKTKDLIEPVTDKVTVTRPVIKSDRLALFRYCISPMALLTGSLVVYFINNETFTEISDAFLALSVAILMFIALYPSMKKTATMLLQTVPESLDVDQLVASIKAVSPLILEVKSLEVWALSSGGRSVLTCIIVLDKNQITSESELAKLLANVQQELLKRNVTFVTIQPEFLDPNIRNEELVCSEV